MSFSPDSQESLEVHQKMRTMLTARISETEAQPLNYCVKRPEITAQRPLAEDLVSK